MIKKQTSTPLTEEKLTSALEGLKKFMHTTFATKEDLKEELEKGLDRFAKTDLAQATISVIEAIEDVENRIDPVLKNHDKRIKSLEIAKN